MDFPLGIRPSLLPPLVLDQSPIYTLQLFCLYADHRWLIRPCELRLTICERATPPQIDVKKPRKEEISYVKVTGNLMVSRRTNGGRMHDRGPISRQQTTDSVTSGRKPRSIRNELSDCNRRGALARAHTAPYPGTPSPGRIPRAIHDRRCRLRAAAGLSGFLPDGRGQLHGVRRSDLVSEIARNDFRFRRRTDPSEAQWRIHVSRFQVLLTDGLSVTVLEACVAFLERRMVKAKFLMLFTALTAAGCM